MQQATVPATFADVDDPINAVGFKPNIPIENNLAKFVEGFK